MLYRILTEVRQVNVPVEDHVYEAAKQEAARRGMIFKRFVEHALIMATKRAPEETEPDKTAKYRDPHYEPFHD